MAFRFVGHERRSFGFIQHSPRSPRLERFGGLTQEAPTMSPRHWRHGFGRHTLVAQGVEGIEESRLVRGIVAEEDPDER